MQLSVAVRDQACRKFSRSTVASRGRVRYGLVVGLFLLSTALFPLFLCPSLLFHFPATFLDGVLIISHGYLSC